MVATPKWAYLAEVYKKTCEFREISANFVMTNDFSLIPHKPKRSATSNKSSANRLKAAESLIGEISSVGQLKSMLRSHTPEKGALSICNHGVKSIATESSHIIQVQGDYISYSSLEGHPCENDYRTIQLFQ